MSLSTTLVALQHATATIGFAMGSEPLTGALLRTLAASKPGGHLLELGTGTGLGTAWLLDGMDSTATLLSIDNDASALAIAREHLGSDPRLTLRLADGDTLIPSLAGQHFDLIFADTWPGKFRLVDETLTLLAPGGLYIIDDLLPQPNWPDGHAEKVVQLRADLATCSELAWVTLDWATGLMIGTRQIPGTSSHTKG